MAQRVVVEWKKRWQIILDGRGHVRHAGDEDVLPNVRAKALEVVGLVKILGPVDAVMRARLVADDALPELAEEEPTSPCTAAAPPPPTITPEPGAADVTDEAETE